MLFVIIVCTYIVCRFSKRNMLLAGLWYSKEKPTMCTFLAPLVEEMNDLYVNGEQSFKYSVSRECTI